MSNIHRLLRIQPVNRFWTKGAVFKKDTALCVRKQIQPKHACGMWGRAELVNVWMSSTWLTSGQKKKDMISVSHHCSSACLLHSERVHVFWCSVYAEHTILFAVMVAGLHVRFVLGVCLCMVVFAQRCVWGYLLPAVAVGGAYSKVKLFIFIWTGQSEGQVLFDSCFSAEECHYGKTNTPGYSFFILKQKDALDLIVKRYILRINFWFSLFCLLGSQTWPF